MQVSPPLTIEPPASKKTGAGFFLLVTVPLLLPLLASTALQRTNQRAKYTNDEFLVLPRVCLAHHTINKGLWESVVPEEERKRFAAQLGDTYNHFHHFCWGLVDMNRASAITNAAEAEPFYRRAIGNFDYVLRHANDSWPLKPLILLRKGQVLDLTGDLSGAVEQFTYAVTIRPDYTPAYFALVDVLLALELREEAERILALGLERNPDSKILKRKQIELAGSSP